MGSARLAKDFETHPFVESPDDIVIAGVSCRLPESDNMQEFRDHLMNNEDMMTEDDRRYPPGFMGTPRKFGKVKDTTKLDAAFFRMSPKQANAMDAQQRLLLEVAYECIVDAGENPRELRGTNGTCVSGNIDVAARYAWLSGHNIDGANGYEILGTMSGMHANRVSYCLDLKGPSYTVDTSCSTSLIALLMGISHIKTGESDFAIICSTNLNESPGITVSLQRLGVLSPDGVCKSFDASADGYARSEGVVALFATKRKFAKRVYCTVIHARQGQQGYIDEGMGFPSEHEQKVNCIATYREAQIDPTDVVYVEAHATGTKVGDPEEMAAILETFWTGKRTEPVLVGSVKSNMGHGESVAGLGSLAKLIIAMEERVIPANLHYSSPNPNIPGLMDGRLKVVSQNTPWKGGLMAINSFGLGGTDVHAILKSNDGDERPAHPAAGHRRLFTCAGRHEEGVEVMLRAVANNPADVEMHALLQRNAAQTTSTHPCRGYVVVNSSRNLMEVQECSSSGMSVWYVFTGMGAQWPGMGRDLLQLSIFRQTVDRLAHVLRPLGLDLHHILTSPDPTLLSDGPTKTFVATIAMQIGLVDLLTAVGIKPDGLLGHSFGELGCAYADGCLTAEEAVLCAYWRGTCVEQGNLEPGAMAAVGMTWEEAKAACPAGVFPACHNSEDTVTVSGYAQPLKQFVTKLQQQGYFAKEVNSCGVAFHSPCIQKAASAILDKMTTVISTPRPRSSKWISSSIAEAQWSSPLARTASAEYFVNNFVSPVLFQEALQHVPKKVVLVEIAPHALLQSILKRSVSDSAVILGLVKKTEPDNVEYLLSSLGRMYMSCVDLDPMALHEAVSFPVSRGTPIVSSLIRWDHSESWRVPTFGDFVPDGSAGTCTFEYDMSTYADILDLAHRVEGHAMFTIAGNVFQTWVAMAKAKRANFEETPFVLEDLILHRATMLPKTGKVSFNVSVNQVTGQFEIVESGNLIGNGKGFIPAEGCPLEMDSVRAKPPARDALKMMDQNEIYSLLALRGLEYGPVFQGIKECKTDGSCGMMRWNGDWMALLDCMMQCRVVSKEDNYPVLLAGIRAARIDPVKHLKYVIDLPDGTQGIPYVHDKESDTVVCGGVEIEGVSYVSLPRRVPPSAHQVIVEEFAFHPYTSPHLANRTQQMSLLLYLSECQKVCAKGIGELLENGVRDQLPNVKQLQQALGELRAATKDAKPDASAGGPLHQLLTNIFALPQNGEFVSGAVDMMRSNRAEITSDQLLSGLLQGPYVKNYLDDVAENTPGGRVSVGEVGAGRDKVYRYIVPKLADEPSAQFAYTAVDENVGLISADDVEEHGLKTAPWSVTDLPPADLSQAFDVIIASRLHEEADLSEALNNIAAAVKERGFLILHETTQNFGLVSFLAALHFDYDFMSDLDQRTSGPFCDVDTWRRLLDAAGFDVIGHQGDGMMQSLMLCRKRASQLPLAASFINVNSLNYSWVDEVKVALADDSTVDGNIWLVATSGAYNGVTGLVACLRLEPNGHKVRCIYNDDPSHRNSFPSFDSADIKDIIAKDLVMNVYRDGTWGRLRYNTISKESFERETTHAYLDVTPGELNSVRWKESSVRAKHVQDTPQVERCSVYYSALNYRDIVFASGGLTAGALPYEVGQDDYGVLGMEFAGRDSEGHRVMGLLYGNGLATVVNADRRFLLPVPARWSLLQAATVPAAYCTAYYALVIRGAIRKGDKVLIHQASGAVGQAAIAVAASVGCDVFATVSSEAKKRYLVQKFPDLDPDHVVIGSDRSFEFHIRRVTRYRGVDVVLNTHSYGKLRAGLRVLAPGARFLDLERTDAAENKLMGMSAFMRNVAYHGIQLDMLMKSGSEDDVTRVMSLLRDGIERGTVQPLDTTVFDRNSAADAFRYMSEGKHWGKVVLNIRTEESEPVAMAPAVSVKAVGRTFFDSRKSYIVVGGLGGVGLEMITWMAERGARHFVLTARSGVTTAYQRRCIDCVTQMGATVLVTRHSCVTYDEAAALINEALALAPVGGIFNLALVGRNDLMVSQTIQNFIEVGEPKIQATENLDKASRALCAASLEHFVTFSSFITGRGSPAVQNYGFANSYMERVFVQRHRDGLPALAIQWGSIGDVGYFRKLGYTNDTVMLGTVPMRVPHVLQHLDLLLTQPRPVVTALCLAPRHQASSVESQDLVGAIKHILGVKNLKVLDPSTTLGDLGMDSMIVIEIQQLLERKYNVVLNAKDTRSLTVERVLEINGSSD